MAIFFCNNLDLHLDKRAVVLGGVHDHDFLSVLYYLNWKLENKPRSLSNLS